MNVERDIENLRKQCPFIKINELHADASSRIEIKEFNDENEENEEKKEQIINIDIDKVYNIIYKGGSNEKVCGKLFNFNSLQPIGEESCEAKIYLSCCDENCNYVAKYMNYDGNFNEINIQIKMSCFNISPKIYQILISTTSKKIFL